MQLFFVYFTLFLDFIKEQFTDKRRKSFCPANDSNTQQKHHLSLPNIIYSASKKASASHLMSVEKQMPFRVIVLYKLVCHCVVLIINR